MEYIRKKDALLHYTKLSNTDNIVLLAKDKNKEGSKKFSMLSEKELFNKIQKLDNNWYEFWTDSQEVKFSLDIDLENNVTSPAKIVYKNCKNVIAELKKFRSDYSMKNVIILKSNPTNLKHNSYHVIFDTIKFKTHKYCRNFFSYLKSKYDMTGCDNSIYNLTVLRCCYCVKFNRDNMLKPIMFKNIKSIYPGKKPNLTFFKKTLITNTKSCKLLIDHNFEVPESKSTSYTLPKKVNHEIFNERKLELILKSLPEKYVDDYNYWIKIGMILHSMDPNYFKLWDEWSKTNSKYEPNLCLQKWKSFQSYDDRKKIGLGTLIKYCQLEGLTDIIPKYDIKSIVESYDPYLITTGNYNKEVINKKYLSSNIFKPHLNKKLLCVQSEKGTGKTKNLLDALFETNKDKEFKSILFLSSRRTFGIKLLSELKKYNFKLYSDIKQKYIVESRIICQIDSILRLELDKYDLIIVDECESLARYITSQHFIKNPRATMIVNTLEMYLREANNVYILDADLSERCMNFYIKACNIKNNNFKLIVNSYKAYSNWLVKYTTYPSWICSLMDDIKANLKLVVPMASNNKAKDLKTLINNVYPLKRVLLIHKESSDSDKLEKLMKINETWIKYDVIIYTPSVCMGVSFDVVDYFDKIYAYGCHKSLGAQEFAQMLHRVRQPKQKLIVLAIDRYKSFDKEEDYITYTDTENMLCNNYFLTQYNIHNNLIKTKMLSKKKIIYPYKDEPIYDLFVRNSRESVLDQLNFTAQVFSYLKGKDYKLQSFNATKQSYEKYFKDMNRLRKERIEEERVTLIEGVLEADELDSDTFKELIKRRDEYLDENDINSIRKYNFKSNYNIPDDTKKEDMRELLDEYFLPEKMRWYRNLSTIIETKEQTTTKKLDILKHNQCVAHTYNNVYQDFTNKNKYAYHFYPLKMINYIGFDINKTELNINYTTLDDKLSKLKPTLAEMKFALFKNYSLRKVPSDVEQMKTAECLRFINKIIYHQYGMKIIKINYSKIEDKIKYKLHDGDTWDGLPNSFSNVKNIVKYEPRSYTDINPKDLDLDTFIEDDFIEDDLLS
jgi:hypothetical protein